MTDWKPLPPEVAEGDPDHTEHHNLLREATAQLQAEVDANEASQSDVTATLASSKASVAYVDAEDSALRAEVDAAEGRVAVLEGRIVPAPHVGPTPPPNPVVGQLWIQKAV